MAGDYQIKTFVNDAGGSSTIALAEAVTAGGGVVVVTPPPTPDPQSATYVTEAGGFTTGTVATFTYSDPSAVPSDFSVAINWGDNTGIDNSGTISVTGTGAGQTFTVQGVHLYANQGTYPVSVQITDQSGHVGIANSKAVVEDAPLSVATLPPAVASLTATEGQPLTNIEVASFYDANLFSLPSDFEATIDWGDGSPDSDGTITQPGGLFSPFVVSGSHTYAEASATPFIISATIHETDGGTQGLTTARGQVSGTTQANPGPVHQANGSATNVEVTVNDAALSASSSLSLQAVEGQPLSNVLLATFTDDNPLAAVREFKATIDWGDGSPIDTGIIHLAGDNTGSPVTVVQVSGSHTYAEEGSYNAIVTLTDVDNPTQPVTSTVPVTTSDAPLVATEKALISATAGSPVPDNTGGNGALVATFTDGNPLAGAVDFKATIAWGDGTSSAGTVTPQGGGVFAVSGMHTFGTAGNYTVTVTIVDQGGDQTTTTAGAVVAPTSVLPTTALDTDKAKSSAHPAAHTRSVQKRKPIAPGSRPSSTSAKPAATIRIMPAATSVQQPAPIVLGTRVAVSDAATVGTSVRSWSRPFLHFRAAARQR